MNSCDFLKSIISLRQWIDVEAIGSSMEPSICSGEQARLVTLHAKKLDEGDVVAFPGRRSGQPVLHRLIKINESELVAVADNGITPATFSPDDALGLLSAVRVNSVFRSVPHAQFSKQIAYLSYLLVLSTKEDGREIQENRVPLLLNKRYQACITWRQNLMSFPQGINGAEIGAIHV